MRIARIGISNHRRVEDLDIDVREHCVLVGPNAVGKTTTLRLIDCALGASWNQLISALDPGHVRDPSKPMVVEVRLEGLDADDLAHFADKVEVGTGSAVGRVWLTIRLLAEISQADPDRLDVARSFVKPMVDASAVTREDLLRIGWVFLPASRSPDRELGVGAASAVRSLLRAVALDAEEATAIREALAGLSAALDQSPALEALRGDLAAELSKVFPTPVETDAIVVDLPSSTTDEPLTDVDVQLKRDGQTAPLAAQSDGLRSLALIAVQLLARRSSRILAIDEPEMHLHPRGQSNLAGLLAQSPGQRIVATHAPAVLARFAPRHAVAVTAGGARQLPAALFTQNPKSLQHWWVDSALEPVAADRIVFVEGISDRILVQATARLLELDLDRCGVTVVALDGASNFKPAIELFGPSGFGVRLFGLVDQKEASIPADALGVGVADLGSLDVLVCVADLEDEYLAALGVTDTTGLLINSGLFTEAGLIAATNSSSLATITSASLVALLRKQKVEAAVAIGESMSKSQASQLTILVDLVKRAVGP